MELAKDERYFKGSKDDQAIIVRNVFEGSSITISSAIGLLEDRENGMMIDCPSHHLKFLYPYLVRLRNDSIDSSDFGFWVGVIWSKDKKWLNLYYLFGNSLMDRIELLEHKFRRDIVFSCGLKLSQNARLMVRMGTKIESWEVGLPRDLQTNGHIEFPQLIVPYGKVLN